MKTLGWALLFGFVAYLIAASVSYELAIARDPRGELGAYIDAFLGAGPLAAVAAFAVTVAYRLRHDAPGR